MRCEWEGNHDDNEMMTLFSASLAIYGPSRPASPSLENLLKESENEKFSENLENETAIRFLNVLDRISNHRQLSPKILGAHLVNV